MNQQHEQENRRITLGAMHLLWQDATVAMRNHYIERALLQGELRALERADRLAGWAGYTK